MSEKRFTILFDLRRCNGCYACQVACKAEHNIPLGVFRIRVNTLEYGEYPDIKRAFIPTICAQAGKGSPLLKSCRDGSVVLDEKGIVRKNREKPSYNSMEIEKMISSDPYGGAFVHPYEKSVDFCDFCTTTRDVGSGELPACVTTCNTEAIYFGDINDSGSAISQYIRKWDGRLWKGERVRVVRMKEREVPDVNVYYIGLTPEMEAMIEGHKQFDPTFLEVQRWKEAGR
ncbi:MAG: hypothetical protein IMF07_09625 [Proteobacteria bacterium]|nr:hypothetical protein [Pseudomonadota bacterium]